MRKILISILFLLSLFEVSAQSILKEYKGFIDKSYIIYSSNKRQLLKTSEVWIIKHRGQYFSLGDYEIENYRCDEFGENQILICDGIVKQEHRETTMTPSHVVFAIELYLDTPVLYLLEEISEDPGSSFFIDYTYWIYDLDRNNENDSILLTTISHQDGPANISYKLFAVTNRGIIQKLNLTSQFCMVTEDNKLYEEPSFKSPVVMTLQKDTTVTILDISIIPGVINNDFGFWIYIIPNLDDQRTGGWAFSKYLSS